MKNKIFNLILITITIIISSCTGGNKEGEQQDQPTEISITIKGSDTVLPLSQSEAENFMKENPDASITVVGGGSGVGIAALQDGTTDLCMSSRELKTDEQLKFQELKKDIKEVTIAFDALSVVVNPSNKITKLTREQIEGIFTGDITNWKEVGGDDLHITAISRESSSGTYEFFKDHVMDKKNYGPKTLSQPATGAIVQSISNSPGAIGYVGIAYETSDVRAIAVSYDQGATYVLPSIETALNKTYPISRPLFYFYDATLESKVKPFVDYVLSPKGQKIIEELGYVPLQ